METWHLGEMQIANIARCFLASAKFTAYLFIMETISISRDIAPRVGIEFWLRSIFPLDKTRVIYS